MFVVAVRCPAAFLGTYDGSRAVGLYTLARSWALPVAPVIILGNVGTWNMRRPTSRRPEHRYRSAMAATPGARCLADYPIDASSITRRNSATNCHVLVGQYAHVEHRLALRRNHIERKPILIMVGTTEVLRIEYGPA